LDFAQRLPNLAATMASLTQILAAHDTVLVLDAASGRVWTGLLRRNQPPTWQSRGDDAGRALFSGVQGLLAGEPSGVDRVSAFVFCAGPGSMLGIRIAAMALRTWVALRSRPVFTYQSLALAARADWRRAPRAFAVIADARRDTWHVQGIADDGTLAPLQRVAPSALGPGELLTPDPFRAWAPVPAQARPLAYDPAALFPLVAEDDLFEPTSAPDVFQHEAPDYKKWSAQAHSAETAPPR
jgi:tRNA threonylcarbamoyladenosine biosynthesis protein TsaB